MMLTLLKQRSLISTLAPSFPFITTQTHFSSLLQQQQQHKPSIFLNPFSSKSKSKSQTKNPNFTLSYLINTCNLSPAWALKLSKRVHLKSPDQPNAVLNLLKTFGFSELQLSLLVKRFPIVLKIKPEKTILPKLQFFLSIGLSTSDLPKLLIGNSVLLEGSLKYCLVPRYNILSTVLRDRDKVVLALKRVPWCLTGRGLINHLIPNVEHLRGVGVPQGPIAHLVCNHLGVVCVEHTKFVEAVEKVVKFGFDPMKTMFVEAVKVVVGTSKEAWEKRVEVYERWGWSNEMCLCAFRRYPQCMLMSEDKVMRTMRFLVKDMGWPAEDIFRTPGVLSPNLEKTIMPRSRVMKVLKERGLVKSDSRLSSAILITEKLFLEKFVGRFQDRVPGLMEVYKGHVDHLDSVL
ncbi:hypothetical protein AAZX31_18G107200 [Glycine max]|uniref:Uncharacterized protein n=1 Tax=Glycine max TaxID=3847 RepID=I1N115_SOYBN|nr:uncharacterized protein LOC100778090 isoform X1 [Glycine max]XP_006602269.1 uncharacterized protein LOC100778090 isoform X1 [Glycine max]KAG4935693.1 hypothetical protein JHK85_050612 [Glycine max]KAG5094309.1 hypothetical protein JHK84_049897 [Glycine max]KAH1154112.1 hypothetical protein GYH30_049654 [Glycine max]KRG98996.1 hypothetical protein GLYMA_18G112900v4 [Glycine max]|eukprot:XP_003551936.1 uncharacterized protein LOC100778090 isoform X1 [Glycine max]